jgi:hypothetical protein
VSAATESAAPRIGDRHAGVKADDRDMRIASSVLTIAPIRRGDSNNGSPPVTMTSQISGRARM